MQVVKICPECNKQTLEYNDEWDKAYERLGNYPTHMFIVKELNRKNIPEMICSNCKHEVLAEVK